MRVTTLIFAAALALAVPAAAQSQDVDLTGADGTNLRATYLSPGQPGPAMLLVHQCNMDRTSWSGIASQLVDAGVHVLTLDLRGFGDSGGAPLRETGFQTSCSTRRATSTSRSTTSPASRGSTGRAWRPAARAAAPC